MGQVFINKTKDINPVPAVGFFIAKVILQRRYLNNLDILQKSILIINFYSL